MKTRTWPSKINQRLTLKKKSIFILGFLQGFPDEEAMLFSLWK
jgi:hypothetical protein